MAYPARVSSFRLDLYEVTVGRFKKFVESYSQQMTPTGAGANPNDPKDIGWVGAWSSLLPKDKAALTAAVQCDAIYQSWTAGKDNLPMTCVTWYEAQAFCIWDGGRLPTEAEWNYAAAGGTAQRIFPWGASTPEKNAVLAVYDCYYPNNVQNCTVGQSMIAPVGSAPAGKGLFGQYDLAGSVDEWVVDVYAAQYPVPCDNCANWSGGSSRVKRSSNFGDSVGRLYTSYRDFGAATQRNAFTGIRCARAP